MNGKTSLIKLCQFLIPIQLLTSGGEAPSCFGQSKVEIIGNSKPQDQILHSCAGTLGARSIYSEGSLVTTLWVFRNTIFSFFLHCWCKEQCEVLLSLRKFKKITMKMKCKKIIMQRFIRNCVQDKLKYSQVLELILIVELIISICYIRMISRINYVEKLKRGFGSIKRTCTYYVINFC